MGFRWILSNIPVLTGILSFIQIFFIIIESNIDMNFNFDVESEPQFRVKRNFDQALLKKIQDSRRLKCYANDIFI